MQVHLVQLKWELLSVLCLKPFIENGKLKAAVEELSDNLIGKDPLRIKDHWQLIYRSGFYRGGPILMSAMQALTRLYGY